jgi:hypothetical protein
MPFPIVGLGLASAYGARLARGPLFNYLLKSATHIPTTKAGLGLAASGYLVQEEAEKMAGVDIPEVNPLQVGFSIVDKDVLPKLSEAYRVSQFNPQSESVSDAKYTNELQRRNEELFKRRDEKLFSN